MMQTDEDCLIEPEEDEMGIYISKKIVQSLGGQLYYNFKNIEKNDFIFTMDVKLIKQGNQDQSDTSI